MRVMSYNEEKLNINQIFDTVCDNHEEVILNRNDDKNIVIMSLDDYNAMIETNYLMSTTNNRERLLSSLNKAKSNQTTQRELIEE